MADGKLVWVDCEMTGLDHRKERIIEIAIAITDGNGENFIEGPNLIIHQPDKLLNDMDDWNKEHHGKSGLVKKVRESNVTEAQAEQALIQFLVQNNIPKEKCPMAGNSIHQDRLFLLKCMPNFVNYLHYRVVDVSTIKELGKRWYPRELSQAPKKADKHRAIDDIRDSINELFFYKQTIFKQN